MRSQSVLGAPKILFRTNARQVHMHQFAQAENGHRFLVLEALLSQVADERLVVVTNWRSTLKH